MSRALSLIACSLLLSWGTAASAQAQPPDTLILATGADHAGRQRMTGRVVDFTGDTLRWENVAGSQVDIAADRVVEIRSEWNADHQAADEFFASGQYQAALTAYARAISAEERLWVRRLILSRAVWCCRNTGEHHRAVRTFLALVASDPATPYLECIPLAWTAAPVDPALTATANQAMSLDAPVAAQLLGASWLLAGTERARAVETLRRLSSHVEPQIAQLANGQLLRSQAAGLTASEQAERLERLLEDLSPELTAGVALTWGNSLSLAERYSEAALAYMRVPVLHPLAGDLAGEAWYRAGKALDAANRREEALLAWNTLLQEHPQSAAAAAARARLEQIAAE